MKILVCLLRSPLTSRTQDIISGVFGTQSDLAIVPAQQCLQECDVTVDVKVYSSGTAEAIQIP